MLKRLKFCFTFASCTLLAGLFILWVSGRAVTLRTVRFADVQSHLFIYHGALQLDCTGLADSLRDFRYCRSLELSFGQITELPLHEFATVSADDMWTFRAVGRYVMRTPLQGMLDGEGKQIFTEQSLPMLLITLPAWLVMALAAVLPIRAALRWFRQPPEERWRTNPIALLARRYVLLAVIASLLVCLVWTAAQVRSMRFVTAAKDKSAVREIRITTGRLFRTMSVGRPWYWEPTILGDCGLLVEQMDRKTATSGYIGAITLSDDQTFGLPYWLLLICTLTVPLTWLLMRFWGKRVLPGHCVDCDYDLRASIGRCPECGREIDAIPPRVIKPARRQIAFFALASAMFLMTWVLILAWHQSMTYPCTLFEVLRTIGSEHLSIEHGYALIATANAPAGATKSPLPVWPFIVVFAGGSGGLLWAGRRIGRPHERN